MDILPAVAAHNTAQNALPEIKIKPRADPPADFPAIADDKNYLLPQAFPEGSPTHPAYGAGHATVAWRLRHGPQGLLRGARRHRRAGTLAIRRLRGEEDAQQREGRAGESVPELPR